MSKFFLCSGPLIDLNILIQFTSCNLLCSVHSLLLATHLQLSVCVVNLDLYFIVA